MSTHLKVLIVGEGGVGKSTFIKRYQTGDFEKIYTPTETSSVHRIKIKDTNTVFNCWDIPGKLDNNNTDNFKGADGAIIMFDITSRLTYKAVDRWINSIKKVCGDIPIVILANKVDIDEKYKAKISDIKKYPCLYTSNRSNYNYEIPLCMIMNNIKRQS